MAEGVKPLTEERQQWSPPARPTESGVHSFIHLTKIWITYRVPKRTNNFFFVLKKKSSFGKIRLKIDLESSKDVKTG